MLTDVLALVRTSPDVTLHGVAEDSQPVKVAIRATIWLPGSAIVGAAILFDVARFQNTERRVALVPPAVPVPWGDEATSEKPDGVESVTASLAVSQIRRPTSPVACDGQTGETAP